MNECVICYNNNKDEIINYKHCGKNLFIHPNCLLHWLFINKNKCIICRERMNVGYFINYKNTLINHIWVLDDTNKMFMNCFVKNNVKNVFLEYSYDKDNELTHMFHIEINLNNDVICHLRNMYFVITINNAFKMCCLIYTCYIISSLFL